jgi:hypothetical protein
LTKKYYYADVMSLFVVDVESDGPIPGEYSMVCFGAIEVAESLNKTFYGQTRPISGNFQLEALAISGFSRQDHLQFPEAAETMRKFRQWIEETSQGGHPVFVSDNVAYDWQFINYYLHRFTGENPFGFSGRRIGDIYSGLVKDLSKSSEWKKYRVTEHTHSPIDDARGNAEALLKFKELGLRF